MCPTPPDFSMASKAARLTPSSGPSRTHGSTLPCSAMPGPTCSRTVAKSTRQSTLRTFAPDSAAAVSKWLDAFVYRITGVSPGSQFFDQKLRCGKFEFAVLLEREFANPGVEQLHRGCSRCNLRFQVDRSGARNPFQQRAKQRGIGVEQRLGGGESILAVAFDHVTRQRPRSRREAQHGNVRPKFARKHSNRFHQEAGFLLRIEHSELVYLLGRSQRRLDNGTLVGQFERQPHRPGGYQDVGKHDDGVHAQNVVRLQRNLDCQLRRLADFQKIMLLAHGAVLGQVPPSLAHDPDRNALDRLTAASAQK